MNKTNSRLNAQFNRAHISENDFKEAGEYLHALHGRRLPTVRRALLISAIIAYSRPFTKNDKEPTDKATPQLQISLGKELTSDELVLHNKLVDLRNQALAHSEYFRKPSGRVMGLKSGFMVQSKPFDLLSERIDQKLFESICSKLALYCNRKKFELNHKLGPTE